MSDHENSFQPPPTGGFPFFGRAVTLANTWNKTLVAQANLWNDQWTKMRSGKYQFKDWFDAVVRGSELTLDAAEEMISDALGMNPTPPWASLASNSKDELTLKLNVTLAPDDLLYAPKMSRLGDAADNSGLPQIAVSRVAGRPKALKVWMTDKSRDQIKTGQYIGFVTRSTSPRPIAIVTVSCPEKPSSDSGASNAPITPST